MKVAVLGAGSFGTALAHVFAKCADSVVLWTRDDDLAQNINANGRHPSRFHEHVLSSHIRASSDLKASLAGAKMVVSALPMKALRSVFGRCEELIEPDAVLLSTTKGVESDSLLFPSQVLKHALPNIHEERWAFLSGPNFASEIIRDLPWAAVIASKAEHTSLVVRSVLSVPNLRLYFSADVAGVEIGGALKNVFAIAAGLADGLDLGCNARAALTTRSLSEMSRFAQALGAEQKTLYGLAGLGDLLLSCTSAQSRNWRVGNALAQGKSLERIETQMGEIAEGIGTTLAAKKLSEKYDLYTPICDAVHAILFEADSPHEAFNKLMSRQVGEA